MAHYGKPLLAFPTSIYINNKLPSIMLNFESPFKLLFHKPPNYFILRVFGCITFPYLRPYHSNKFDFHTEKCVFISYSLYHKGYKCLFITGMIYIMHNVKLMKMSFSLFMTSSLKKLPLPSHVQQLPPLSKIINLVLGVHPPVCLNSLFNTIFKCPLS